MCNTIYNAIHGATIEWNRLHALTRYKYEDWRVVEKLIAQITWELHAWPYICHAR